MSTSDDTVKEDAVEEREDAAEEIEVPPSDGKQDKDGNVIQQFPRQWCLCCYCCSPNAKRQKASSVYLH